MLGLVLSLLLSFPVFSSSVVVDACLSQEIVRSALQGQKLDYGSPQREAVQIKPFPNRYANPEVAHSVNEKLSDALASGNVRDFCRFFDPKSPHLPERFILLVHPMEAHLAEINAALDDYPHGPRFALVNDIYPLDPSLRDRLSQVQYSPGGNLVLDDLRLIASQGIDLIGGNCEVCLLRSIVDLADHHLDHGQKDMNLRIHASASYSPGLVSKMSLEAREELIENMSTSLAMKGFERVSSDNSKEHIVFQYGELKVALDLSDWGDE